MKIDPVFHAFLYPIIVCSLIGFSIQFALLSQSISNPAPYGDYRIESLQQGQQFNLTFPEPGNETIDNASVFAVDIGNRLGFNISNPDSPNVSSFNPERFWFVETNNEGLGPSYFLYRINERKDQWYRGLNFECSDASNLSIYYENESAGHNLFTGFKLEINESKIFAPNYSGRESIARNLSLALGLTLDNLTLRAENLTQETTIPSDNGNIIIWLNQSFIGYTQRYLGYFLDGSNQISFLFNESGYLIRIEGLPFISISQSSFHTSPDDAMIIGRRVADNLVSNKVTNHFAIISQEIYGLRLAINGTANQYALAYGYLAYLWDERISEGGIIIVYVDVNDGSIIYSFLTGTGVAERNGPITPSWANQLFILFAIAALGFLTFGIIVGPPEFTIAFFGTLVAPLYIRIKGLDALENFNRGRLYEYINAHPGQSYNALRRELHLKNGNLSYHLVILEKFHLIKSSKGGNKKLFFPASTPLKIDIRLLSVSKIGNLILSESRKKEILTTSVLAATLGMSRQRINYHLKILEKKGLIEPTGNGWKYVDTDESDKICNPESNWNS